MSIFPGEVEKNRILDGTRDRNNLAVGGEKSHSSHGLPVKVRIDEKKIGPSKAISLSSCRPNADDDVATRALFFLLLLKLSSLRFRFNTTVENPSVFFLRAYTVVVCQALVNLNRPFFPWIFSRDKARAFTARKTNFVPKNPAADRVQTRPIRKMYALPSSLW